jgi:hypothetical protein
MTARLFTAAAKTLARLRGRSAGQPAIFLVLGLLALSFSMCRYAQAGNGVFTYFPTASTTDARFLNLTQAGSKVVTLGGAPIITKIRVPAGTESFEVGIFDGDSGRDNTGALNPGGGNWDTGSTETVYTLIADPNDDGTGTSVIAELFANQPNAVVPGVTLSGPIMPNNDWYTATVQTTPVAQAKDGSFVYRLIAQFASLNPVGANGFVEFAVNNFKLRTTGVVSIPANTLFSVEGGLRQAFNDGPIVYPEWNGELPGKGSDFFITTPTTYNGQWNFWTVSNGTGPLGAVNVPEIWDGGFDFGTVGLTAFPSGVTLEDTTDTDDPDTPNIVPGFAAGLDNVQPEGADTNPLRPDDSEFDFFRRAPSVRYSFTDLSGTASNDNPSGSLEFELFVGNLQNGAAPAGDPLPEGFSLLQVTGLDLANNIFFFVAREISGVLANGLPPAPKEPKPTPATVTLTRSPSGSTVLLGTQVCYTATVRDAEGNPLPDQPVTILINGGGKSGITLNGVTGANGQVVLCFTPPNTGSFTAVASSGAVSSTQNTVTVVEEAVSTARGRAFGTAQVEVSQLFVDAAAIPPQGLIGRAAVDAQVNARGRPSGKVSLHVPGELHFTSRRVTSVVISEVTGGLRADISGHGRLRGFGAVDFQAQVWDLGKKGSDIFTLTLFDGKGSLGPIGGQVVHIPGLRGLNGFTVGIGVGRR